MRAQGVLAVAITTVLWLSACTDTPRPEEGREVPWSVLQDDGLDPGQQLAVFVTTWPDAEPVGFLALVDREGDAKFVETDAFTGPALAASNDVLCVSDQTQNHRVVADSAERRKRGGYPGGGHWSGVRDDDTCVLVLNSGVADDGYETDVHWEQDGKAMHSVVPDIPGPAGQSPDAVWVRSGGLSTIGGELSLYRTDLASGQTIKAMTWPTLREPANDSRPALDFDDSYASDLFWHQDRLYFIEDVTAISPEGESVEIKPGITSEVRLAEIDPAAKTYNSTPLRYTAAGLMAPSGNPDAVEGPVPVALRDGYVSNGSLYTADGDGHLLAVDLGTKKLRTVGRFSETALSAVDAVAAWKGSRLALVLTSADGDIVYETYDLDTGELTSTQKVNGFSELLDGDQFYIGDAAILD